MGSGINKPLDRIAKELVDESSQLLLRILGLAPPGSEVDLQPMRAESAPPVVMPDYVAKLRVDRGDPFVFHAEFYDRYRQEIPTKMARYGGSLAGQYSLPVESVALLLSSDCCPDVAPEVGIYRIGKTTTTHEFRTVKLWELDPEPVLESGDPAILPWALLMRLGREGARKIGAKVAETGDEASISRFLLLGELRYDRAEVEEMLGGDNVPLAEALVLGSSTYRRSVEAAEAKGKAEEVRRLLKLILAREHPGLEASPEIDRIQDIGELESLLVDYSRGSSREIVELAIRAAAQSH